MDEQDVELAELDAELGRDPVDDEVELGLGHVARVRVGAQDVLVTTLVELQGHGAELDVGAAAAGVHLGSREGQRRGVGADRQVEALCVEKAACLAGGRVDVRNVGLDQLDLATVDASSRIQLVDRDAGAAPRLLAQQREATGGGVEGGEADRALTITLAPSAGTRCQHDGCCKCCGRGEGLAPQRALL